MKKLSIILLAIAFVSTLFETNTASAQSGTWTNLAGGNWSDPANWQGGTVASGADNTADFSTLSLTADVRVTLDAPETIGSLIFGDKAGAHNWFLVPGVNGTLTFSASTHPTTVTVTNQTATLSATLAGIQGLTQNGNGTLILKVSPDYFGGTTNDSGTFELFADLATTNNPTFSDPLVINGLFESAGTLSLDVNQNNDTSSTNISGSGTLRLISTNNSSTTPDLFFCPDAFENSYWGSAMDVSNLDLGDVQRYIFANTGHNAVALYNPRNDARINSSISGTGGITYIAQDTYPGTTPMECQLILAGSNSFTGPVEIQRGSIYLENAWALVQTNKFLMDPTNGNNARFFLYGNNATIANLESSGAGGIVIANGNVLDTESVAAATLTVVQTSNTVFGGSLLDGQYEYDPTTGNTPGPLSIVKTGLGALTITGPSGYSGSTTVSEGELVISATSTNDSAYTVADGAELGIAGINGNGMTMSDLALGTGGSTSLQFNFSGSPVTFIPPVTTASLEVNGAANSILVNIGVSGAGLPVGQFPLIQYTSGSIGGTGAGSAAFKIGTLPPTVVATVVANPTNNSIDLKVTTGTAAPSQNGTWTSPSGGSWVNSANWLGGNIASGIGFTADFSTVTLSANATVTLDGPETIGNLIFGDAGGAHNWTLNTGSSGPLTLRVATGSPTITVSNETATIAAQLVGTHGLTQNGNGTLVLVQPVSYSGGTTNNSGTLELLGNFTVANNPTFAVPLIVDGVVESGGTLTLDVNQNGDAGSTNVIGDGTLRLIGTTNGSTQPDLYFGPDAVANDYYGAAIDVSNLDLGDVQRYIFAKTEHNSVANWDPYEDARINSSISGNAGITFIAQNTYGGDTPMECPLVLAGSNSFLGPVEIQRGSIYLLNTSALVQTNKLLLDPAVSNNARFFLYGNGATVANLESTGAGTSIIANGNLLNTPTIAPATLSVIEKTNTTFGGILLDGQYDYDPSSGNPPGALSLLKTGPGTLTLTGPSGYSGSTTVAAGELTVSATSTNNSSYSVADGAAMGIGGIATNGVTMTDLALGVSGSTTVEFFFNALPGPAPAPITTASLEANGPANSVTVNIHANVAIPIGQFPLIQFSSGTIGGTGAGFGAFHLGTLPTSMVAKLVQNAGNNSIDLMVTTASTVPVGQAPVVSGAQVHGNGVFELSLSGAAGSTFTVHGSTNAALRPFSAWPIVGSGTIGSGVTTFDDPSSTNSLGKYYLISAP